MDTSFHDVDGILAKQKEAKSHVQGPHMRQEVVAFFATLDFWPGHAQRGRRFELFETILKMAKRMSLWLPSGPLT